MKSFSKLTIALLAFTLFAVPAFAQKWSMPGKGTAVPCTTCVAPGTGKLTVPFNEPLVRHVGRYVDSSTVGNVQHMGMRTVRGRVIRTYPEANRIAVALGETVGLYKLDTFFTSKLPAGMVAVNTFKINSTTFGRYSDPFEKLSMPDRYFYCEAVDSEWIVTYQDTQRMLNDFDMDDRGYLYVSTLFFGWGMAKDDGTNDGTHLDYVTQVTTTPFTPTATFSLKSGSKYYVVVATPKETHIHDVTSPEVRPAANAWIPPRVAARAGTTAGVMAWTKHHDSRRLAVIHGDGVLRVYDYSAFVSGGAPLAEHTPPSGRSFRGMSFDESGRLWVAEFSSVPSAGNAIWKLSPTGNSYAKQTFTVYTSPMSPIHLHAAGGYVAVSGSTGAGAGTDVLLMKVEGGAPRPLQLDHFFRNYYSKAPSETYVALDFRSPSTFENGGVQIVEQGKKTYLMFSGGGLADAYEIQGGDSISISQLGAPYGTPNPNARSTEEGPFYGDILEFKASASNPAANYSIDWDFGNPDSGNENSAQSGLNEAVTHQFTGLNTMSEVQAVKKVTAKVSTDASIADERSVTLKVPKARIAVPGLVNALTQDNKTDFEVVAGDEFADASDGVVEGHYSAWAIDGVTTKKLPNETIDVGALGTHTLALSANYGKYNATTLTGTNSYAAVVSNISYSVKPFIATIKPPVTSSTNYTFGAVARVTELTNILSATQWTVTWSIEAGPNSSVVTAEEAQVVPVGTIPDYIVPKTSVHNGDILKLQISVDPASVPALNFATYTTTMVLEIPEIAIAKTGCINAESPCTLTASSANGGSTNLWQIAWTVKRGTSTVKTGTGLSISFTPSQEGTYTATAKETSYNVSSDLTFSVAPIACQPVPEEHQVEISTSCGNNCVANQPIEFEPSLFAYTVQPCDTFSWTFGDTSNNTATGRSATHTYSKNGNYRVTLTIKNNNPVSNTRSVQKTISIGGTTEPPVTCSAPVAINVVYSGPGGCGAGTPCKVGDGVKFTALRGGSPLLSCDNTLWSVDDAPPVSTKSPTFTFTTAGTHTVTLVVSNLYGETQPITTTVNIAPAGGSCNGFATELNLGIEYSGAQSGCSSASPQTPCRVNEVITFTPTVFGYSFQACDKFSWSFGDNTTSTAKSPTKTYSTQANSYQVSLKVSNTNNAAGATVAITVPFSNVGVKPTPKLTANFPATGSKGQPVTFTVVSDINATGWTWDFNDGTVDTSQASVVGKTTSISHTFTSLGEFSVRVTARNAEDTATAPTSFTFASITITDTPEYRYLLPVVIHAPGQNNSVWRTDVQVYNPDPEVSANKPLVMKATLRNLETTLNVSTSTYIYEDFMQRLTSGDDSGPVIITTKTKYAPQIWTRTYNQAENGTFGQFIPAIRLDTAGGGASVGEGKYFLAGLRNDPRYRTNVGFINPNAQTISATVRVFDDVGLQVGTFTRTLAPFQLNQLPITHPEAVPGLKGDRPFSIEIEVPQGQWLIAYASFIDGASNDPVFLQAVRESEVASEDFRTLMVPGVGHIGAWRSDVSVFNPNSRAVAVDLEYYNGAGAKVGSAAAVPIGAGAFLQYDDLLRQGIFGNLPDSVGMLRVVVPPSVSAERFPIAFARTYNDNGSGKTYGQGIRGFSDVRANVKPGTPALIPAVRSNSKYYTNVGLTNVTPGPVIVTVKVLDSTNGAEVSSRSFTLQAYESIVATNFSLEGRETASLKIEASGGNAWGFASIIDRGTFDPEYVPATPLGQ